MSEVQELKEAIKELTEEVKRLRHPYPYPYPYPYYYYVPYYVQPYQPPYHGPYTQPCYTFTSELKPNINPLTTSGGSAVGASTSQDWSAAGLTALGGY